VLKKAGIIVATATAGLLAVSPLAFAGDKDDNGHKDHKGHHRHHDDVHIEDSTFMRDKTDVEDSEFCNNYGQENEAEIINFLPFLPPAATGVVQRMTQSNVNVQCSDVDVHVIPDVDKDGKDGGKDGGKGLLGVVPVLGG
jgi:hypothetical protein